MRLWVTLSVLLVGPAAFGQTLEERMREADRVARGLPDPAPAPVQAGHRVLLGDMKYGDLFAAVEKLKPGQTIHVSVGVASTQYRNVMDAPAVYKDVGYGVYVGWNDGGPRFQPLAEYLRRTQPAPEVRAAPTFPSAGVHIQPVRERGIPHGSGLRAGGVTTVVTPLVQRPAAGSNPTHTCPHCGSAGPDKNRDGIGDGWTTVEAFLSGGLHRHRCGDCGLHFIH